MSNQSSRLLLTRRGLLVAMAVAVAGRAEAAATHPSVIFMRQVAKDMLNAHRQGTVESFRKAILRYADVQGIAL